MKKIIVLSLAFIAPVIGAIIFKFYSKSHFEVKVMYQDSVPSNEGCSEVAAPYSVADTITIASEVGIVSPFMAHHLKIIGFSGHPYSSEVEMNLIADSFHEVEDIAIYLLQDSSLLQASGIPGAENIQYILSSAERMETIKSCHLLFEDDSDNAALIDEENRIRGFYNLRKREEVDSLIIETKILLRERELDSNGYNK